MKNFVEGGRFWPEPLLPAPQVAGTPIATTVSSGSGELQLMIRLAVAVTIVVVLILMAGRK